MSSNSAIVTVTIGQNIKNKRGMKRLVALEPDQKRASLGWKWKSLRRY